MTNAVSIRCYTSESLVNKLMVQNLSVIGQAKSKDALLESLEIVSGPSGGPKTQNFLKVSNIPSI